MDKEIQKQKQKTFFIYLMYSTEMNFRQPFLLSAKSAKCRNCPSHAKPELTKEEIKNP